jgi:hypothetical protein
MFQQPVSFAGQGREIIRSHPHDIQANDETRSSSDLPLLEQVEDGMFRSAAYETLKEDFKSFANSQKNKRHKKEVGSGNGDHTLTPAGDAKESDKDDNSLAAAENSHCLTNVINCSPQVPHMTHVKESMAVYD